MSVVQNIEAPSVLEDGSSSKSVSRDLRMLRVLAIFSMVWGVLCLINFTITEILTIEQLMKSYSTEQLAYLQNTPGWASFAKAMTAVATLTGAVYLFLRKKSAYQWFSIAFVGTLLVALDSILRDGFHTLGGMETGVNLGMVIVSIFLFWVSYSAFYDGQLED